MAQFNGHIPARQPNYGFDAAPAPHQHPQPGAAQGRDYGPSALMRGLMRGVSSFINYRTKVSLGHLDYCQTLQRQGADQTPFEGFSQHLPDAGGPAPQQHAHGPAHHRAAGWQRGGDAAPAAHRPGAPVPPDTGFEATMRSMIEQLNIQIRQLTQHLERSLATMAAQMDGHAPEAQPTRDRVNSLTRRQSRRDHVASPAPEPQAEDPAAQAMNLLGTRPTARPGHIESRAPDATTDDAYRQDEYQDQDQDQDRDRDRDDGRNSAGRSRPIIDEQQLPGGSSRPAAAAGASEATDNTYGADSAHDLLSNAKAQTNLQREGRDQAAHLTR